MAFKIDVKKSGSTKLSTLLKTLGFTKVYAGYELEDIITLSINGEEIKHVKGKGTFAYSSAWGKDSSLNIREKEK